MNNIVTIHDQGNTIAVLNTDEVVIYNTQTALDLLMTCVYNYDTSKLMIQYSNIDPSFFDLKNGKMGDMLQKFSTYNGYLSIIGDFENIQSKSLRAFIIESNRVKRINFVQSRAEGIAALT